MLISSIAIVGYQQRIIPGTYFNMNIEHFHVNEIFDYNGQGLWIDELFPAVTSLFGYLERVEHLKEDDEDYHDFLIVKILSFLKEDPTELVIFAVKILKVILSKCS